MGSGTWALFGAQVWGPLAPPPVTLGQALHLAGSTSPGWTQLQESVDFPCRTAAFSRREAAKQPMGRLARQPLA